MKTKLIGLFLSALSLVAAETNKPTFIDGVLNISYDSRVNAGKIGAVDTYSLALNVNNSVLFAGTIKQTPRIADAGVFSTTVKQAGKIGFDLSCDVINPRNTNQTRNIGKVFGEAPINEQNVYLFDSGSVRIIVHGQSHESKFRGMALGKPPAKKLTSIESLKQQAMTLTKNVNGKAVKITVAKYDKMGFQSHVLAGGPVPIYSEATVNGEMLYDYARSAWHFQNVSILYSVDSGDGRRLRMDDKLTGSIRWVEKAGEYEFDVRVNEPPPSEASSFTAAADETSFFETDNSIPSLSGKMKYKDTKNGETVTSSQVSINLVGNRLSKQQTMNLCKLILLTSIVPLNAE